MAESSDQKSVELFNCPRQMDKARATDELNLRSNLSTTGLQLLIGFPERILFHRTI